MIIVTVGTLTNREKSEPINPANTTLREVLEKYEVDYSVGLTSLDGATLSAGDLDKTFSDMGVVRDCFLLNNPKIANA